MNVYSIIENTLKQDLEEELLTTVDEVKYSRADILAQAAQVANLLVELGAKPGDRVSVQVHKSVENLTLYLGCLQAGLVFHPLNPAYQTSEIEYFLGNAEPTVIVCDPEKLEMMESLGRPLGIKHIYTMDQNGKGSFSEARVSKPGVFETIARSGDDLASLLYSSGTTGVPKGIMLSHDNLASNGRCLVEAWGFTTSDRLLHMLPIFHVHGLFVALSCILFSGGSMRWAEKFSPDYVKTYLPECTSMMGVPTFYTRLLADSEFGPAHCKNMRLFTSGSAPLLVETFNDFQALSGHTILERYGMTETGMNCSNPLNGKRKPGTVGPALPGVSVRIVNGEGEAIPTGEVGDLQVRGENVFGGYWRMPEKTAEDFTSDGFFNTGDQASLDEDGYVSIVGRSKDMVISGGLNVYPKEVEDLLNTFNGVRESAVIGVPHPDLGEAVVAVIVPDSGKGPSAEQIIAETKGKLANFKVPKHVEFVESLPRNTMSKVQKKALREKLSNLFTV